MTTDQDTSFPTPHKNHSWIFFKSIPETFRSLKKFQFVSITPYGHIPLKIGNLNNPSIFYK